MINARRRCASCGWFIVLALFLFARITVADQLGATVVNTGQIQGKVVLDSSGAAVSGAVVTAYRISPAPTVSAKASTGQDGSFTVPGLSSGQFGLCVIGSTATLLDPCKWVDLQTTVKVTDGSATSGVVIRLKQASALNVRLNDVAQALAQTPGGAAPPHVLVGVFDLKGIFHPLNQTQNDSTGVTYELDIPFDYPVRLTVYSVKVKLQTGQSAPVAAAGYSVMVVHPSGQSQQPSLTFKTVGLNP
jgi:hypothetical protein